MLSAQVLSQVPNLFIYVAIYSLSAKPDGVPSSSKYSPAFGSMPGAFMVPAVMPVFGSTSPWQMSQLALLKSIAPCVASPSQNFGGSPIASLLELAATLDELFAALELDWAWLDSLD